MSERAAVLPATTQRWDDVAAVLGTRGDPARCWCQWFRLTGAEWRDARVADHRAALRAQVSADPPAGVVGYLDGVPSGWCAVAPRPAYRRLARAQVLRWTTAEELADPGVWSVTCFVVRTAARRRGLSGDLLAGAIDLARTHGARVVEGYPVDPAATRSVSSSGLYHGVLEVFLRAGFHEVARPQPARPVVRLEL